MTATELCSGALRQISSLAPGEGIPGAEADNALSVLNQMLAGWSAEPPMVPYRTIEGLAVAAGVSSRTIGSGAQLDTARPDAINAAYLRDSSGNDYPLDVTMTAAEYDAIGLKTAGGRPQRLFYDTQYPNGVIYFDCQTDAGYTLYLDSRKPVAQFSSLAAAVTFPGEYQEGIKYLLAERLAPEYGMPVGQDLRKLIEDARRRIKAKNLRREVAGFDPALLRPAPFNVYRGS